MNTHPDFINKLNDYKLIFIKTAINSLPFDLEDLFTQTGWFNELDFKLDESCVNDPYVITFFNYQNYRIKKKELLFGDIYTITKGDKEKDHFSYKLVINNTNTKEIDRYTFDLKIKIDDVFVFLHVDSNNININYCDKINNSEYSGLTTVGFTIDNNNIEILNKNGINSKNAKSELFKIAYMYQNQADIQIKIALLELLLLGKTSVRLKQSFQDFLLMSDIDLTSLPDNYKYINLLKYFYKELELDKWNLANE